MQSKDYCFYTEIEIINQLNKLHRRKYEEIQEKYKKDIYILIYFNSFHVCE